MFLLFLAVDAVSDGSRKLPITFSLINSFPKAIEALKQRGASREFQKRELDKTVYPFAKERYTTLRNMIVLADVVFET